MKSVYTNAGIDPKETGYVEAHGTGTKVGDPIEAAALHKVFGEGRSARAPLFIGSVKSNIGHLEAASGKTLFTRLVFYKLTKAQGSFPL
jgi:acyl transferase domain-containing protein